MSPSPASEITELGTRYVLAEDDAEKEDLALELVRAFHPYLAKYLDMIVRGHLPAYGAKINEDAKKLLQYLLPKGTASNKVTLAHACKHLHLAFKGYEAGEIYNVLGVCVFTGLRG